MNDLAELQDANDVSGDEQDIRVEFDGPGNLVQTGSQLADYQRRGDELSNVSVWDFISCVDKVKKSADRPSQKSVNSEPTTLEIEEYLADRLFDNAAAEENELNEENVQLLKLEA